jgi:hypothetical protein
LSREQLFGKLADARAVLCDALQSGNPQSIYLAILVLLLFAGDATDEELRGIVRDHLGDRACRIRRFAARAVVALTAEGERGSLFYDVVFECGDRIPLNLLHGNLTVLRILLMENTFPPVRFVFLPLPLLPPFLWNDYLFVVKKLWQPLFEGAVCITSFVYDEVSLFVNRQFIGQPLSSAAISSLLLWTQAPPQDLSAHLATVLSSSPPSALLSGGLDFLARHCHRLSGSVLLPLLLGAAPPDLSAALVRLVNHANINGRDLDGLLSLFRDWAFVIGDCQTPIHLALCECLPLLLSDARGMAAAMQLTVDDVPAVRVRSAMALCRFLGVEFASEAVAFRLARGRLGRDAPEMLLGAAARWVDALEDRVRSDVVGELLTVFVDEFFIVREVFTELEIAGEFVAEIGPLTGVRKAFIQWARGKIAESGRTSAW